MSSRVIQGRFRKQQWLQPWWLSEQLPRLIRPFVLLLLVGLGCSVVVYAMTIQVESRINGLGQLTRNLNEVNKTLQVELNRAESYNRIAEKATQHLPSLHLSEEVIDVPLVHDSQTTTTTLILPKSLPVPLESAPHAPGY